MHSEHSPFQKEYMGERLGNANYLYSTIDPLFPFGFGLGYAQIVHGKMTDAKEVIKNCKWRVSVDVSNKSPTYDSYELVQLYFTKWVSNIVRYELSLAGFSKVFVPRGQTVTVD